MLPILKLCISAVGLYSVVNPRRACAARVTVLSLSVCLFYHVFCHHAHRDNKRAIEYNLYQKVQHYTGLIYVFGDFRKSNAFESYGVKTKLTSEYAV